MVALGAEGKDFSWEVRDAFGLESREPSSRSSGTTPPWWDRGDLLRPERSYRSSTSWEPRCAVVFGACTDLSNSADDGDTVVDNEEPFATSSFSSRRDGTSCAGDRLAPPEDGTRSRSLTTGGEDLLEVDPEFKADV